MAAPSNIPENALSKLRLFIRVAYPEFDITKTNIKTEICTFSDTAIKQEQYVHQLKQLIADLQRFYKSLTEQLEESVTMETSDAPPIITTFQDTNKSTVDPNNVQIKASKSEIERRISAFIEKKRIDVNENNKRDFCYLFSTEGKESTCARTDAVFIFRAGSKSHVKVSRVYNQYGPQSRNLRPSTANTSHSSSALEGIPERLSNMEKHLNIDQERRSKSDVFSRLKTLENRILHLESISPEYFNYVPPTKKHKKQHPPLFSQRDQRCDNKYEGLSITEVDEKIKMLETDLKRKAVSLSTVIKLGND